MKYLIKIKPCIFIIALCIAGFVSGGCKKETLTYGEAFIYMPQSTQSGGVNNQYLVPSGGGDMTRNFRMNNGKVEIMLGVSRSSTLPSEEFTVDVVVRDDETNSFVSSGAIADAIALPAGSYSLPSKLTVTASNNATFYLSVDSAMLINDLAYAGQKMVLAVGIANPTKYELSEKNLTMVIIDVDAIREPFKDWLSGTATPEVGNGADPAKYFGDWRGTPVEIGQTWPNTPDVWGINPQITNSWAGFEGPMSLSYTPGPDWVDPATGQTLTGWRDWATVARGGNDAWWTAGAKKVKALRAGKGTTYISPFYEFNGDWMDWSVTRTEQGYADFKAGWKRVSDIWRREFPEAKIMLPAAMSRNVPAEMMPDPSTYDLGGGTIYNAWPWEENGATALQKLEAFRQQIANAGKPFAITEWANSANPNEAGGGGDAPGFIAAMHAWMKQHAGAGSGKLVFETFFNIAGYPLDHEIIHWDGSAVKVSTTQPLTAAKYSKLF